MSVRAVTHLNFRGDARAALDFYRSVFGGDLTVITYEDAHNVRLTRVPRGAGRHVVRHHAEAVVGDDLAPHHLAGLRRVLAAATVREAQAAATRSESTRS